MAAANYKLGPYDLRSPLAPPNPMQARREGRCARLPPSFEFGLCSVLGLPLLPNTWPRSEGFSFCLCFRVQKTALGSTWAETIRRPANSNASAISEVFHMARAAN